MPTNNDHTCNYVFTHKTGIRVIAQSWAEYYKLQGIRDFHEEHRRTGTTQFPYHGLGKIVYEVEQKVNRFWKGAIRYEKIGNLHCIGTTHNPMRIFLKNVHNHACMQGDLDTLIKAQESDMYFWSEGAHTHHLLPAPK